MSLKDSFRHWMPGDPPAPKTIWPWAGPLNEGGYGYFRFEGSNILAHRAAWEIFRGSIPEGLIVRHRNDTPCDVNPWNLELGTMAENSRDMMIRQRRSANVLTEAEVLEIRRIRATRGMTLATLGDRYGVTEQAIWAIEHRKSWRHI